MCVCVCVCSCLFSTSSVYLSLLPEEKMKSLLPREIVESRLQIAILDMRVYVVFLSKVHSIVPKLPSPCQPSSFHHFSMDCKWRKLRESAYADCCMLSVVHFVIVIATRHKAPCLTYRLYLTKCWMRARLDFSHATMPSAHWMTQVEARPLHIKNSDCTHK